MPLVFTVDSGGSLLTEFKIFATIGFLIIATVYTMFIPFYDRIVHFYTLGCNIFLFWVCTCTLITLYLDVGEKDNIGIVFLIAMTPIFINFSFKLVHNIENSTI
jgi:hypothetical protein